MTVDLLEGRSDSIDVRELAAGLVAREDGSDGVDDEAVERYAIRLHHIHLPKLAERGVVEYDAEANRVKAKHARSVDALATEREEDSAE